MYTDAFGKELLEAHNNYRASHDAPPLKWSKEAASKAKKWVKKIADKGVIDHGEHDGMGQNIAHMMSSGGTVDMTGQQTADLWYKEIKDYDFSKPGFGQLTGHFTQVVWTSTTHIGAAKISKGSHCYVVANYLPPGNVNTSDEFKKNVKKSL